MILLHVKSFEFSFCFADWIISSEVGFEFLDEQVEIQKPSGFVWVKECGFETMKCGTFQVGQNIIDLSCIVLKQILTTSEVEFALEDESAEFLGVRTIKWVGFPEFGFGTGVICFDNVVDSLCKYISFSIGTVVPGVLSGVSLSTGSMCADSGCVEDILVGVGGLYSKMSSQHRQALTLCQSCTYRRCLF